MIRPVVISWVALMFAPLVECGDPGPLEDTTWMLESLDVRGVPQGWGIEAIPVHYRCS